MRRASTGRALVEVRRGATHYLTYARSSGKGGRGGSGGSGG